MVYVGGGRWLKTSDGGGGWLKMSEYCHVGKDLKLIKKPSYDIWMFQKSAIFKK